MSLPSADATLTLTVPASTPMSPVPGSPFAKMVVPRAALRVFMYEPRCSITAEGRSRNRTSSHWPKRGLTAELRCPGLAIWARWAASARVGLGVRIVRVACIHEARSSRAQQHFHLLNRLPDLTPRLAGLNLPFQFDESLIRTVEPPRQHRRNVKKRGRIISD